MVKLLAPLMFGGRMTEAGATVALPVEFEQKLVKNGFAQFCTPGINYEGFEEGEILPDDELPPPANLPPVDDTPGDEEPPSAEDAEETFTAQLQEEETPLGRFTPEVNIDEPKEPDRKRK